MGAVALTMLFSACKKNDNNGGGGSSANNWVVDGTTYAARTVTVGDAVFGSQIAAASNSGDAIQIVFGKKGITEGIYKIVDAIPAADEIAINVYNASLAGYSTTGNDSKSAVVTVSNGKCTIVVPNVDAENLDGSKTVKISANLTQQ